MSSFRIIGLMSGTSLDGLDITFCTFSKKSEQNWDFDLHLATTIPYPDQLRSQLKEIMHASAWELIKMDHDLAILWAEMVSQFIEKKDIDLSEIDVVASHGQTIFHRPDLGITTQIGNGQALATALNIPVISDFRNRDVQNGGQGAPLVPIGDQKLFEGQADAFLNIGGFTNITIFQDTISAFDIGPGNLPLNFLCQKIGLNYDENGATASKGRIIDTLLNQLNSLSYYELEAPKSLGTEWLNEEFIPLLNNHPVENALRTVVEHIAVQIASVTNQYKVQNLFVTGGGAHNSFLIERVKHHAHCRIVIPEVNIINFKESIVFGFLGALHLSNEANCLREVTGARKSVRGGTFYSP